MIKKHMLVLEDKPDLRANVVRRIEEEFPDFTIDEAGSTKEAKRVLKATIRKGGVTRVVIVDEILKVGEPQGSDLLVYLQENRPEIAKVIYSAEAKNKDIAKAINRGGLDRYVFKGPSRARGDRKDPLAELLEEVHDILQSGQGPIYDALIERLKFTQAQGGGHQIVMAADREQMTVDQLLQHIIEGTTLGQQHLSNFAQLVHIAFEEPARLAAEIDKLAKHARKKPAGGKRRPGSGKAAAKRAKGADKGKRESGPKATTRKVKKTTKRTR